MPAVRVELALLARECLRCGSVSSGGEVGEWGEGGGVLGGGNNEEESEGGDGDSDLEEDWESGLCSVLLLLLG